MTIVHFHGGAYISGSPESYFNYAAALCRATGGNIVLPDYRLAPEHRYPAQIHDALAVYRALIDSGILPSDIILAGDSAGGNLVLVSMLCMREEGLPLPAMALLLSPWADLTLSGKSYASRANTDPYAASPEAGRRAIDLYLGTEMDLTNPMLSPVFGTLAGLPALLIQVGENESLLDDSWMVYRRARAQGVDAEISVWPKMVHQWQLYGSGLDEATAAVDELAAYILRTRRQALPPRPEPEGATP